MARYFLASNSQMGYGIEGTSYSEASTLTNYLGLIRDDVDTPNPNPNTPMATGGERRGPHVNSPDPREYQFTIPVLPIDDSVPLEVAMGKKTTTSKDPDSTSNSGDEYDEHLYEEQDRLPTATFAHWQDGELEEKFVGSKASLAISAQQGEPLSAELSVTAAKRNQVNSTGGSPSSAPDLSIPNTAPYRFWMLKPVDINLSSDGSDYKDLATANSLDFNLDNGLEVNNHGDGRDGYSVSETTAEEKYDIQSEVTISDMDLYDAAVNDKEPTDWTFTFARDPTASTYTDAFIVRLLNTTITSAPVPSPGEGKVSGTVELQPRKTEIEIRTPA